MDKSSMLQSYKVSHILNGHWNVILFLRAQRMLMHAKWETEIKMQTVKQNVHAEFF